MKVVADAHIPYIKDYFGVYDLHLVPGRSISNQDIKDADILLVRSITPVNAALLAGSKLKFVGSVTAGADHLDTLWLEQNNITWTTAAGFNAPPVADYVMSIIASLQKQKLLQDDKLRIAVIGVGNVGRLVVNNLKHFGYEVLQSDPIRAELESDFVSTPLDQIEECDLILIHVPLTYHGKYPTHHFINRNFLQRQKNGCVIVNASRGVVVNSQDLLTYGSHLHICLDVWENEPQINKQLLQRVTLATPHIAGYSVQSKIRGIEMIYQIAVQQHFIEPLPFTPRLASDQRIVVSGERVSWQDVVLQVFNPESITQQMRDLLLPAADVGPLFDEMRNQFNYRHEFSATKVITNRLNKEHKLKLNHLGFKILTGVQGTHSGEKI